MDIVVVGAGTMGLGIAQVSAMAGHNVVLGDAFETALEKAKNTIDKNLSKAVELGKLTLQQKVDTISRISYTHELSLLKCDMVIEAIIEKLDLKVELFNKLASVNGPECIFATNTSSIPITQISAQIEHPERVIGIHFFNPAHVMKLVEIVSGAHTSTAVAQKAFNFVKGLGKTPIMAADAPGFIVNRVARHYYVESLKILEENVTDFETIDTLLESVGFKMGPFRLMDLIGVDTNFSVTSSMYALFHQDEKFRPSRIQQQKVDAGFNGRKSGKGFYEYN
jgi:3-hydroxybutyryl-CoA dehydrogenase